MLKSKLLSWHTYAPDEKLNACESPIEHNTPNTNSPESNPDLVNQTNSGDNKQMIRSINENESSQYYSCESAMTKKSQSLNNSLFEQVPIFIDTECFFLLGLHYCRDTP